MEIQANCSKLTQSPCVKATAKTTKNICLYFYNFSDFLVDIRKSLYYYITVCFEERPCPVARSKSCEITVNRSASEQRRRITQNPTTGGVKMANIKSAKKRILVIETKTLRNKMIKSKIKTLIKKVDAAVAAGDKALAAEALKNAVIALDKAGAKGIFHKNTIARKVSQLTKAVNAMA